MAVETLVENADNAEALAEGSEVVTDGEVQPLEDWQKSDEDLEAEEEAAALARQPAACRSAPPRDELPGGSLPCEAAVRAIQAAGARPAAWSQRVPFLPLPQLR